MPKDIEKTIAEEAGLDPNHWVPVDREPLIPGQNNFPIGAPPIPSGRDPYNSGPLPPFLGLETDLAKTDLAPGYGTIRLVPLIGGPHVNAKTQGIAKSVATVIVQQAIAAIPPPTADPVFGASGTNHSAGDVPDPGVTAGTGKYLCENATFKLPDGLIHSADFPWETDPAAVIIRDDFFNNNTATGQIGDLGWAVGGFGIQSDISENSSGGPPAMGFVNFQNTTVANQIASLALKTDNIQAGSTQSPMNYWPLLDYPNWKLVWIFGFSAARNLSPTSTAFSMAKKTFYLGLKGISTVNDTRPYQFIGLRFDKDPTAPAISDTTFQFEEVHNTYAAGSRNNTQGQTFDTGITPTDGVMYRLEMTCTAVGQVVLRLTDSNGNTATTTFTVSKYSVTASITPTFGNGYFTLSSFTAAPFGVGAPVTITGGAGYTGITGTFPVFSASVGSSTAMSFFFKQTISGAGSTSLTLSGYAAMAPIFIFGNDTEAAPVANVSCYVDFFGFVWNPGVGGGTGTPNASKVRYF